MFSLALLGSVPNLCYPVLETHRLVLMIPVLGDEPQSRMVPSSLPLASVLPSGVKTRLMTQPVCPSSARLCLPLTASHKLMVLYPQFTSVFPSGLKVTFMLMASCPVSVCLRK